jgi:hypothetical protein
MLNWQLRRVIATRDRNLMRLQVAGNTTEIFARAM